ncbi:hypothetical protein AVEN_1487-1 [Araneus ventricosus]|uniref:Uncharacterized protein n=1 Tax=Araneus ventricosus TaxID=182803 RepID=A0A4Y2QRV5_ARAVE|nr:hypothetical protein AVEN_1487-1 [Araneus ventricosus]
MSIDKRERKCNAIFITKKGFPCPIDFPDLRVLGLEGVWDMRNLYLQCLTDRMRRVEVVSHFFSSSAETKFLFNSICGEKGIESEKMEDVVVGRVLSESEIYRRFVQDLATISEMGSINLFLSVQRNKSTSEIYIERKNLLK